MSLKNKIIGAIVASALAASPAFAVEGSDGMHYTSASEGFYASIRLRFNSGETDKENASIANQSSRLGVQGTGEMSHGLEGFYRYESAFSTEPATDDGTKSGFSTRLGYVGIRGGFGSFRVGSDWSDSYNWVTGSTDIANVNSGNFNYNDDYAGRSSNAIHYRTPDFNGLQVAARFEFDGGNDTADVSVLVDAPGSAEGSCAADVDQLLQDAQDDPASVVTVIGATGGGDIVAGIDIPQNCALETQTRDTNDSELDAWELSAKYAFSGFTVAGTFLNRPDYGMATDAMGMAAGLEDKTAWAVGASYGQDNWGVSTWYGENNASDFAADADDETVFSIAGNVSVGKSGVYVVHESKENASSQDDTSTAFGVEYRLNSKSKTWIEYAARDYDSAPANDDFVTIGLRHDF